MNNGKRRCLDCKRAAEPGKLCCVDHLAARVKAAQRYYKKHRESVLVRRRPAARVYRARNKARLSEEKRRWYERHRDEKRARDRARYVERRAAETPEQREARLIKQRAANIKHYWKDALRSRSAAAKWRRPRSTSAEARASSRKARDRLSDGYVCALLGLNRRQTPLALIDAKRAQMMVSRAVNPRKRRST